MSNHGAFLCGPVEVLSTKDTVLECVERMKNCVLCPLHEVHGSKIDLLFCFQMNF